MIYSNISVYQATNGFLWVYMTDENNVRWFFKLASFDADYQYHADDCIDCQYDLDNPVSRTMIIE